MTGSSRYPRSAGASVLDRSTEATIPGNRACYQAPADRGGCDLTSYFRDTTSIYDGVTSVSGGVTSVSDGLTSVSGDSVGAEGSER